MAIISDQDLKKYCGITQKIEGDYAEIGVFKGDTFVRLVNHATTYNKVAHAFDSFLGMANNSELDFGFYPKGKLSIGGLKNFQEILNNNNLSTKNYKLFEGYIPHCFQNIDKNQKYSLVIIDVDQYKPTLHSLYWVWEKIVNNGILILDDYFKNREGCAAKAIDDWMKNIHPLDFKFIDYKNTQLILQKNFIENRPFIWENIDVSKISIK